MMNVAMQNLSCNVLLLRNAVGMAEPVGVAKSYKLVLSVTVDLDVSGTIHNVKMIHVASSTRIRSVKK
jgi:hypothetical protein